MLKRPKEHMAKISVSGRVSVQSFSKQSVMVSTYIILTCNIVNSDWLRDI